MEKTIPKRWEKLKQILEQNDWKLDRISGSHHVFIKPGHRCIPVAFHGGTITPKYASLILKQANLLQHNDCHLTGLLDHDIQDSEDIVTATPELAANNLEDNLLASTVTEPMEQEKKYNRNQTTQANIEAAMRKGKEIEASKQKYHEMNMEKAAYDKQLQHEKNELLEEIQVLTASNDYEGVLRKTESIVISDLGSSSNLYDFNCNILFYHTISSVEYAMSSLEFNSKTQQDMINEALDLTTVLMQASPERRKEIGEMVSNLKARVLSRYLDEVESMNRIYICMNTGIDKNATWKNITRCLASGKEREKTATKEEVYEMMDSLVKSFEFIVPIIDKDRVAFSTAAKGMAGYTESFSLIQIVKVVIRRMLILFDEGEYNDVTRISKAVDAFVMKNTEKFDLMNIAMSPFINANLHRQQFSPATLRGIANHVQNLIPIYKFCEANLGWIRLARVYAEDPSGETITKVVTNFNPTASQCESMIAFTDMLLSELSGSDEYMTHFTRTFIFDSFMDPIMMGFILTKKAMLDGTSGTSRRVMPILKEMLCNQGRTFFDALTSTASTSLIGALKKKKYDRFRVRLLQVLMQMLRLIQLFDKLRKMNSNTFLSKIHLEYRYMHLPQTLRYFYFLIMVLFEMNPSISSVCLLQQIIVMQMDLDDADALSLNLGQEAKDIVLERLPPDVNSATKIRSEGILSLSSMLRTQLPIFLMRYTAGKDKKRLLVIDGIACSNRSRPPVTENSTSLSVESLAFDTIQLLAKFGPTLHDCGTDIAVYLEAVVNDKSNHYWCDYTFKSTHHTQRWAKQKSNKYSKLINRLCDIISTEEVKLCLTGWEESVNYLLETLKLVTIKYRQLPQDFDEGIAKNRDITKVVEAAKHLPQWNHEHLQTIRIHIIQLLQAAEKLTTILHLATGNKFPITRSIFNDKWEMAKSSNLYRYKFDCKETSDVVNDVNYINAILEEFEKSHINNSVCR